MKAIVLTQGKVTVVDDGDYGWLKQYHWYAHKKGNVYYAARAKKTGESVPFLKYMHREILNPPDGMQTDHIDGDGLNNRRSNLRICTIRQNQQNQRLYLNKSSKYKGVCWSKGVGKWLAQIRVGNEKIYLGYYINEQDAALAYNEGAIKYFGVFARLNKVDIK